MNLFGNKSENSSTVNYGHVLFVEGKNEEEFDVVALKAFLNKNLDIEVKAMGGCSNVYSAAEALFRHYPRYYFLIDRDDKDIETVEDLWSNFPDPEKFNMLMWRKREFENYFLNPDYLEQSKWLIPNPKIPVRENILKKCQERLYMEAANLALQRINQKYPLSIKKFKNKQDFDNKNNGVLKLEDCANAINNAKTKIEQTLQVRYIKELYTQFIDEMTGGIEPLKYGEGSWLERISGKEVFHEIANDCFQVKEDGKILTGIAQHRRIAEDLFDKVPFDKQPDDFQELVEILRKRISL